MQIRYSRIILLVLAAAGLLFLTECRRVTEAQLIPFGALGKLPLVEDRAVKNVIFIIGDGTGLAHLAAGQLSEAGADGYLNLQRMPVTGITRTRSANSLTTDSAAGATAYFCGEKTNNGMIGMLPDAKFCKTLLELAAAAGKSTGLVVTSTVTHATPAAFAAHVPSRSMEDVIAEQYLMLGPDVILGGGLSYFVPQSDSKSKREDNRNLLSEFSDEGYEVLLNERELKNTSGRKLLGLFANGGISSSNRLPSLKQMTEKALDVLNQNDKGFFLMIEGSQIDWGAHSNNIDYVIREIRDLDEAVQSVLDFAVNDGETLVVFTADHETGGLTLLNTGKSFNTNQAEWVTDGHTAIPVVTMAYGPHAVRFTGW